jgi:hypothetical protein
MRLLLIVALLALGASLFAQPGEPFPPTPRFVPDPGSGVAWEESENTTSDLNIHLKKLQIHAQDQLPAGQKLSLAVLLGVLLLALLSDRDLRRRDRSLTQPHTVASRVPKPLHEAPETPGIQAQA